MLTAECQLERFLLENPPNEKNIDTAAVELPSVQQELLKIAAAHPKVWHDRFSNCWRCTGFWLQLRQIRSLAILINPAKCSSSQVFGRISGFFRYSGFQHSGCSVRVLQLGVMTAWLVNHFSDLMV